MTESPQKESVILCEGYHDRAFWAGWLEHLGCTDPGRPPGSAGRVAVLDPWGHQVTRGQFGYHSKSGKFIRIFPCEGDRKKVLREARSRLDEERQRLRQQAAESRLARLVLNVDPDVNADGTSAQTGFRHQDLWAVVQEYDPSAAKDEHGDFALFDSRILVSLVRWETSDQPGGGLPNQQTLERLACAAVVAAYPARGTAVQNWLDSRPDGLKAGPKEFAWSHMAGWYAEFGCEPFYRNLWRDKRVVAELRSRLAQCGAWRVAEASAD